MASETMSRFKKFLASGKKPVASPGKGARPEGSPKATVFKSKTNKTNKKPVSNKKSQFKTAVEKSQNNARRVKNLKGTSTNKTTKKTYSKTYPTIQSSGDVLNYARRNVSSVSQGKEFVNNLRKEGKTTSPVGIYFDRKKGDFNAAVTKEELQSFKNKKGDQSLKLRDYLNEKAGLTRRSFGGMAIKGVKDPSKIFKG